MTCFQVVVQVDDLPRRPKIYEPWPDIISGGDIIKGSYTIDIPVTKLTLEQRDGTRVRDGFVRASSRIPPEVMPGKDIDEAHRDLQRLTVRNIPWDRYFDGKTLKIYLSKYDLTAHGYSYAKCTHKLVLERVEVI